MSQNRSPWPTVLLVEDDAHLRGLLARIINRYGLKVVEAGDITTAFQAIQEGDSHIDLLIADFYLPGGTGSQVAEELRRHNPKARVIIISGYLEQVERDSSYHYLAKPFATQELIRLVTSVFPVGNQD